MKLFVFVALLIPFFLQAQIEHTVSLYYENDVYIPNDIQRVKIDSLKQMIVKSDSVVIQISGYANAYGTDSYNLNLSKKRALTVASLFNDDYKIKTRGFGELESTSAQDRRVDILLVSYIFEKEEEKTPIVEVVADSVEVNDLSNLEVGDKIVLKGILFYGGTDQVLPNSNVALQELYTYLDENSTIHIKLIGHICCHGNENPKNDGYNTRKRSYTLSTDRARMVYGYLIRKGISETRVDYEGRAYLEPLGKGDKYDRRVEIEIIK